MGTGIISSGISGLQAAQLGLMTTEHNITNANTPGFSRQRTVQATNIAMLDGSGYIGQGTNVATIERLYNSFLSSQVNRTQSSSSELDAYYSQIKQLDNMLADPTAGISPAMQDFFAGIQQVSANPSQLPARQAMVSAAQSLVARFQSFGDQINQMYDGVNSQITSTVSAINSYAQQIADLNQSIIIASSATNQPPNDLMDQRDQVVLELNKLVKVSTTTNTNGSYNVYIGSGQQLVTGAQVTTLESKASAADPSRLTVAIKTSGATQEYPESLITGGSLGGLLSFRSGSLDKIANDLGRNAASLALTFNAQNALGQDLLGQLATDAVPPSTFQRDFFTIPLPTVIENDNNGAGAAITAALSVPTSAANFTNLTNSDYRLDRNGANYTMTRLSDGQQWPPVTIPPSPPIASIAALSTAVSATEGFTFAGVMSSGDSFIIQPTRAMAQNIAVNAAIAADPRLIAAASPIRTQVVTGNTGNAVMSAGSVATGYTTPAGVLPATFTYANVVPATVPATQKMSATVAVSVTHNGVSTAYAIGAPWSYVSGDTIAFNGISFQISGTPNSGDTFKIERNASAVSDGRNALALGQLQTQNTMSGQKATYQSAYAQLVSDVGNKSREVQVRSEAQSTLLKQAESARDSVSGVNLDEEAANLMRYQQAYQASAKVLDLGNRLFDSLLSIMS